jgi:putative nucleotidyltransferase with HDIG domain
LINPREFILEQKDSIIKRIIAQSGSWFDPHLVDLFEDLARKEFFWFDIKSPWIDKFLAELIPFHNIYINSTELLNLSQLFARIVDRKSSFTFHHSASVSQLTGLLSKKIGWSPDKQLLLKSAALLHDIGKLVVPENIIQKAGALTPMEYNIIKQHTYYTYWLLKPIVPESKLAEWAAYHHEKLNGSGYPFGKDSRELDLESRVIAIADIFTALREDRPYRQGLNWKEIERILLEQVKNQAIDKDITELLVNQRKEVDDMWREKDQTNHRLYERYVL